MQSNYCLNIMNILKEKYIKEAMPKMKEKFGYKNNMAVPKLEKAVLNVGIPAQKSDKQFQELILKTLSRVTGQRAVTTKARKSISSLR